MSLVFFVVAVMLAGTTPAHAYLDPGTGSLLLQGAIAAIAATFGVLSVWWARIKQILGGLAKSAPPASTPAPAARDSK
jgi:hypothetical protein